VAESINAVLSVSDNRKGQRTIQLLPDLTAQEYDRQSKMLRGEYIDGAQTAFDDLDKIIYALPPGEYGIIAARPGMGKTTFASQMLADNYRKLGKIGGFVSLEMSVSQLQRRMTAQLANINSQHLERGKMTEMEWHDFTQYVGGTIPPIPIDDTPSQPIERIGTTLRRMVSQHGIEFAVIDYVQLIPGTSGQNRNDELGHISRMLKMYGRMLNLPIWLVAQLSRDCEKRNDKRPLQSDLRDSGNLEQDAYIIVFLYREKYYNEQSPDKSTELLVRKNRNGPTGTARAIFDEERVRFLPAVKVEGRI